MEQIIYSWCSHYPGFVPAAVPGFGRVPGESPRGPGEDRGGKPWYSLLVKDLSGTSRQGDGG